MKTEFEIKVLDIDTKDIEGKLRQAGFTQQPPKAFRRYVYNASKPGDWIRLRTDGTKITLTFKSFVENAIDGFRELEFEVSDFDATNELLEAVGFKATAYQENRRSLYVLDDIEISVDEWPHIPAYLEIEAKEKATVETWLKKLGLTNADTTSETTAEVYKRYGKNINTYDRLTF
jgi:adenylate cyclase class 2